jgi:[acyl-carrier-protein] S-malonyltransferase
MDIAAWEAFKSVLGTRYSVLGTYAAGLSLGEYAALVAAGTLSFEVAVRAVRKRAELMHAAAQKYPGKMAAIIGLDREKIKEVCLVSGRVDIANLNCPGQTVISGEKAAVDKAKELALEKGASRTIDLEVSGAFHSSLMQEAALEFKNFLEQNVPFEEPKIPVVSNVDARPKVKTADFIESLTKQIYSPVLWEDSMKFILSKNVTTFFEFGPGKVLKGLMRRIDGNAQVINIEKKEDILSLQ